MTPPAASPPVGVIDVGSNSIKLLVARREATGRLGILLTRTLESRIGGGLSACPPTLYPDAIARGVAAVRLLAAEARAAQAARIEVVATSAVRDAANGDALTRAVADATGLIPRILSGDEEARLIGRGLRCDPTLGGATDFTLFDLGGGSLELVQFRGGDLSRALSLPLGCVRLTGRFVADPQASLPEKTAAAVAAEVAATMAAAGLPAGSKAGALAVATGGTASTARAMLAARAGQAAEAFPASLPVPDLRRLLAESAALPLADRRALPGLSAARADVFPVGLATLLAVADLAGATALLHSWFSLRHGVADALLESRGAAGH